MGRGANSRRGTQVARVRTDAQIVFARLHGPPPMSQYARNQVFTTGQISKICQVAPRTVSKWFDSGRLRGYRIPGSNDRRVPRDNLESFMREHGIPLGPLAVQEGARVLLVGVSEPLQKLLRSELPSELFEFKVTSTAFEAGVLAAGWVPECVIVDTAIGKQEAEGMARGLTQGKGDRAPLVIALLSHRDAPGDVDPALFHDRFRPPYDVALLAGRIRRLAELAVAPV